MRDHILNEIRRLAELNAGNAPGAHLFKRETGILESQWRGKFWARWSDALIEAGYEPNKWTKRLDSKQVLNGIIAACRHYGRLPTRDEIELYRKTEPSIPSEQAIKRHFGKRSELISALAKYAVEHDGFTDIIAILPDVPKDVPDQLSNTTPKKLGYVYLMKMGSYYKIGATDDLERRMRQLSAATPEKISFVHFMKTDDPFGIEAYWKNRFKSKQSNNEWFNLSSLDISTFKKLKHY